MIHIVNEPNHGIDIVYQRKLEWLQFQRDREAEVARVLSQLTDIVDGRFPLLGRRNNLLFPDIFAQDEQHVVGFILVGEIEVAPAALHVKSRTLGLKSISPTATQAMLTIGKPALSHSRLMSRRSLMSMSSGSAKISMVSKPISLVMRMPNAVSRPAWAQAELIRPSFMGFLLPLIG